MIFAEGANTISITGPGTLNGNGKSSFRITHPQNVRPVMMRLLICKSLIIRDLRFIKPANWTCHLLGCSDVIVDGCVFENSDEGLNKDGIDFDSCQRVTLSLTPAFQPAMMQ